MALPWRCKITCIAQLPTLFFAFTPETKGSKAEGEPDRAEKSYSTPSIDAFTPCNQNVSHVSLLPKGLHMRRDAFQAIADPTRRAILGMIAHRSLSVNSVAENFDVSRTAIYKHMKILTECGLVVITQQGRERYCEARLKKLREVSAWVDQYRKFWAERFDNLDNYLKTIQTKNKNNGKAKQKIKRSR
jgi:DNA-binding transcriptional ArsR family regulator